MKKVVLKVGLYDNRIKQKAMKSVSGLPGVESVSVDMKDKKMTLVGKIDPVNVVDKLRKCCDAELVYVGAANAKEDNHQESKIVVPAADPLTIHEAYPLFNYQMRQPHYNQYYYVTSGDDYPNNGCVIC